MTIFVKILAALLCIGFGLFALFYRDAYFNHFYVRGRGLKPEAFEPNTMLDCHRGLLGVVFLLIGVVTLLFML